MCLFNAADVVPLAFTQEDFLVRSKMDQVSIIKIISGINYVLLLGKNPACENSANLSTSSYKV